MLFTVITPALVDQIMAALSTALVYSLLQGVALAALAGLVILLTRRASPAMRYNLLIVALVLFSLSTVITFAAAFSKIHQVAALTASVANFTGNIDLATIRATATPQKEQVNYFAELSSYITAHHNTIVLFWFLVICIKAIQLAVGLQDVYRFKRTDTHAVTEVWINILHQMMHRMGIKQKIELLESGLAKVPMVIGHLKPAILIPVGLLAALSTAEVEAILMHELAHIRRRDYLVNLLQSLVEIVFFFNPAVLWVSQLIKIERENCCDDIALAQNTSKHSYIQALVSCEEYQQASPVYTVAFSGHKNTLIGRVKRMVNNRNHSLNMFEKTLLTIGLVVSGLCLSAFAERDNIKKTIHQVVKAITHNSQQKAAIVNNEVLKPDLIKEKKIMAPIDTVPVTIKKEIPFDEAAWFRQMDSLKRRAIAKIAAQKATAFSSAGETGMKASRDTGMPIISETNAITSTSVISEKKLNLKELMKQDSVRSSMPIPPETLAVPDARRAVARNMMDEMVKDGLMKKGRLVPFSIDDNAFVVNGKKQPEEVARKYRILSKEGFPRGATAHPAQSTSTIDRIILQMARDKFINDGEETFSFKLNNDEFVVNGQKQPEEVFQKYLNDFVKKEPGGKMSWAYSNVASSKQ